MKLVDRELWQTRDLQVGRVHWRANLGTQPVDAVVPDLVEWAKAQRGHWCAVVEKEHKAYAITDNPRSFPILFTRESGELLVSSTPSPLIAAMSDPRRDVVTAAEFVHSGYLVGPQTLIEGVSSVQAGSVVNLNSAEVVGTYRMPTSYAEADEDPMEYMAYFYELVAKQFEPLVDTGRQLLVPLSGGADSRLIVLALKAIGAQNVLAFTYGTPGSPEVRISREVAQAAGYEWKGIELDREHVRRLWLDPANGDFLRNTWSGESLPHIQDWYALQALRQDPAVAADAVVLPGHTIVGNEYGDKVLDDHPLSIAETMDVLTGHFFDLQGKKRADELPETLQTKLHSFLEKTWDPKDRAHSSKVLVEFNLLTRQPRYINNSMRGYEYFGFDWALPMLNADVWDAWLGGPRALHTEDRHHYVRFIQEEYSRAFSTGLSYFATRAGQIAPQRKEKIKTVLAALHLLEPLLNIARIRTERRHPMAFDALAGRLSPREFEMRLVRGQKTLGIYSDLFLANEWVPGQIVVPER